MKPNRLVMTLIWLTGSGSLAQQPGDAPWLNPDLPAGRRAADLVSRMTLEEKVLQMQSTAPAIPRLGVPAYNWWNEALHGVAEGRATVFPQAIGLAATWDTELMYRVADVISTEARAKYNDALTRVPYARIPISENDSSGHRVVARDAEREAIVLLKNEGGVLPLGSSVGKIAVLGPSADDPVALLGNYHGVSSKQVTPLEGLERQFSAAQVRYALGATYTPSSAALVPSTFLTAPDGGGRGVLAEYFDNADLQGQPKLRRTEPRPYFDLAMEDAAVLAAIGHEKYSVRWTATLTAPATGEYEVTARTGMWNWTATARLFVDEKEIAVGPGPSTQVTSTQPAPGPRQPVRARLRLDGGRQYAVRVEYRQPGFGGTLQLGWIPPADVALAEAEALVKDSDVAIVFVGLSSELEGEEMRGVKIPGFLGGDRTSLDLPDIRATVRNTSARDGDEVVQLYLSGGQQTEAPIRSLRGFQRLHLRAGESREVTFTLQTADLPKTPVEISVGGGQPVGDTPHVAGRL